ncbi:MAG: hypothetical protein IT374_18120 [Polyangiaceae bacterium]|nr:hypothetical protein [Polyangiaceae bacterium]
MTRPPHPLHARLLDLNRTASEAYVAAEPARRRARAKHPTFVSCIKCMDGRLSLPTMTGVPIGMIKPFRAMGGRFEAYWPGFLSRVRGWVDGAQEAGAHATMLISYHHSESQPTLGCSGWGFDKEAARAHAAQLRDDLALVFGDALSPIVIGIETDRDALTLHGVAGDVGARTLIGASDEEVRAALDAALPDTADEVRRDLTPLFAANARRVAQLIAAPRETPALGHAERVLAIGQGFDWLTPENLALIVDDADPALARSVEVAAEILAANVADEGDEEAVTIFASVTYSDPGIDKRQAEVRARGLQRFAERVVAASQPRLVATGRFLSIAGVVWSPSRRLELLDGQPRPTPW